MEISPLEVIRLWNYPETRRNGLLKRSEVDIFGTLPEARRIISAVQDRGDFALSEYTDKFDDVDVAPDQFRVTDEEISEAYRWLKEKDIDVIREVAENIRRFHENHVPDEWMKEFGTGISAGQLIRPLKSVGVYAPGGSAQYPSSVLMSVIPAKVAGVEKVTVCTPPNSRRGVNPATLIAADIAEADKVYRVGGAQAIAAMAYGTQTISSVDKIVGPGNIYVTAAKMAVAPVVDIDFMAGPSEVLILADSTADPRLVALDLVAQAEHGTTSASVLVTTSENLAEKVSEEIKDILEEIPRKRIAARAIEKYGCAAVVRTTDDAIDFVNDYAPEHLQIMVKSPDKLLDRIKNFGAVFVGSYSPVSAGDFAVGPSHVLPTGKDAKKHAGLSVYDFLRLPSIQELTRGGLKKLSEQLESMSRLEGLSAHAKSIRERLEDQ